jgi:hypothetical protein
LEETATIDGHGAAHFQVMGVNAGRVGEATPNGEADPGDLRELRRLEEPSWHRGLDADPFEGKLQG